MNNLNPLAGLIGNYGDSDEESDDGLPNKNGVAYFSDHGMRSGTLASRTQSYPHQAPGIHPAPVSHCLWSACYDESSGYTYYWNQQTNAVTWEAPPEYLLALKLAQQHMHSAGSTEVSAEEWQLYQQALVEKHNTQNKVIAKAPVTTKPVKKSEKHTSSNRSSSNKNKNNKLKRRISEEDVEKIELITSYHNTDSESETEEPVKPKPKVVSPPRVVEKPKNPHKRLKTKPEPVVEYGPSLPPNHNYSKPIGPDMPKELIKKTEVIPEVVQKTEKDLSDEDKKSIKAENEDSQDENDLLIKLKDKAKLLEKLGGEIPTELQKIIEDETKSLNSPKNVASPIDNIDDMLEEIEKKELPIAKISKVDIFEDDADKLKVESPRDSPKSLDDVPPVDGTPLFPSIQNIDETDTAKPKVEETNDKDVVTEKKGSNLYLSNTNDKIENVSRKKLRISNSVLPGLKKADTPAYTTKYSQFIEGFSSERTGLGFAQEETEEEPAKNTISYGNGLTFTKGETLNEDKKEDDLDDLTELIELKLKYLDHLQPCNITPVHEMLIQLQCLAAAFRGGALSVSWWRRWALAAGASLAALEADAAPAGWTCAFQRSEGRYRYTRESDGLAQWEYPAAANMDMDISETPPHPGVEGDATPPPLPPASPPPPSASPPAVGVATPPPPPLVPWSRVSTPPPPQWDDPPPPGCDDMPPLPTESRQEIDELATFYNDIAELEKQCSSPQAAVHSPEAAPAPPPTPPAAAERDGRREDRERERERERDRRDKDREKEKDRVKRKSKVKISASVGLKHKSVSNLVAKWQQVAEEIHSD